MSSPHLRLHGTGLVIQMVALELRIQKAPMPISQKRKRIVFLRDQWRFMVIGVPQRATSFVSLKSFISPSSLVTFKHLVYQIRRAASLFWQINCLTIRSRRTPNGAA